MSPPLDQLYQRLDALQQEIRRELQQAQHRFAYRLERGKVIFDRERRTALKPGLGEFAAYLFGAEIKHVLTAPVIYSCIVPAVILDAWVSTYQAICFPVWGIPRVKRADYIVIDRHYLPYLNPLEKLNCVYCGYFNGLIAYVQEIAGRTEQYWCPIRHAHHPRTVHSRYPLFVDYGDAEGFRDKLRYLRRHFDPAPWR
ncbi:hypothetical protein MIN45_P0918 [Methylomarinovum tepidoasis]|uniref:Uncharacterized protein n=1 Tax=Methylomarinovum tepidoasis TaxID=2840183 RepID=A0AAU9C5U4_9GAMM|nr:hypothetical protein [Methylomarinovum sp. IN45]BCX88549.1 hypothetical protein MIN45_P0918 [Methylomarinovum sp. IN45]